jgi:hypothetical protein
MRFWLLYPSNFSLIRSIGISPPKPPKPPTRHRCYSQYQTKIAPWPPLSPATEMLISRSRPIVVAKAVASSQRVSHDLNELLNSLCCTRIKHLRSLAAHARVQADIRTQPRCQQRLVVSANWQSTAKSRSTFSQFLTAATLTILRSGSAHDGGVTHGKYLAQSSNEGHVIGTRPIRRNLPNRA